MWIKKSEDELQEKKLERFIGKTFSTLMYLISFSFGGPPGAISQNYGCLNCGTTTENVFKDQNGKILCSYCKGDAYKTDLLKWV